MLYHTLHSKKNNKLALCHDSEKGFVVSDNLSPYQFNSKKEYLAALGSIQENVRNFEVKTYGLFEVGKRPSEKELKAFLKGVFWDEVFEQLAYMYPLEVDDMNREKYKSFAKLVMEKDGYGKEHIACLIETAVINGMRDGIKELD